MSESGGLGSSRSGRKKSKTDEYDYCQDLALQGRNGLDAVLEFTNNVAASGRREYFGSGDRSTSHEASLLAGFTRLKARLTLLQGTQPGL
jgi:hypothetical protein